MLRRSCTHPEKASFHCDPLPCDPTDLVNTNGAGDAALAAVVHELVAARLEGDDPWRAGAERACVTRSTFAEIAQYASRVAHEIVRRPQARLASAGVARYSAGTGELSHSG
ncbi:MAG TPA: hypothetical protein DCM87_08120 [Planctomycetes bacterium]|nr:hypothetical protein [Planctomycetota bacterium]